MSKGRLGTALGRFAALLQEHVRADGELLEQFIRKRDETAFAALVRRQGPMVLGVCRRVLGNEHDAEDAFQATFLVLARRAATVRPRNRVANWLYGVAYRTALEARRAAARRRAREARAVPRVQTTDESPDDLRQVLDEELARLPDRYREVIVLCELQGHGRKEVARQLGCPEGTVASRLARARSLLAASLTRRGLALSGTAVAAMLAPNSASASVPAPLASATVKAAGLVAAGQGTATAGVISAQVTFLAERVVRTMFLMKLKSLAVLLVIVGVLGSGAGLIYYRGALAGQPEGGTNSTTPAKGPAASKEEPAQKTMENLRRQVRELQDQVASLHDQIGRLEIVLRQAQQKAKPEARQEVLYEGKPASFWIKKLQDRAPKFRIEAVKALGAIGEVDGSVIPIVVDVLKERNGEVCAAAQQAIVENIGKEAIPSLVAVLKSSKDYQQRTWLIETIRGLTIRGFSGAAKDAVPALISLLKTQDQTERLAVAMVLGEIGPEAKAAVPSLIELLKNKKSSDWYVVASALGHIGPGAKEAVPALMELLKRQAPERLGTGEGIPAMTSAIALGNIGPDAKAALPALRKVLKTEKDRIARGELTNAPLPRNGPGNIITLEQAVTAAIQKIEEPTAAPPEE